MSFTGKGIKLATSVRQRFTVIWGKPKNSNCMQIAIDTKTIITIDSFTLHIFFFLEEKSNSPKPKSAIVATAAAKGIRPWLFTSGCDGAQAYLRGSHVVFRFPFYYFFVSLTPSAHSPPSNTSHHSCLAWKGAVLQLYVVLKGNCMSQKIEKPVLSGQRIKTRKRDEKEKYDPTGFRDAVLLGLEKAGNDLEAISKYLDTAGSKLDYRRYGEALFDILIAGGLLVPGGSIAQDGDKPVKTTACVFAQPEDMESMKNYEQVFTKLMRRYKYLEKMFEEEMKKVLVFMKGFTPLERIKLARMTALWISNGSVPPTVLSVLINEHLVKDNLALDFLMEVFVTWKQEKGLSSLMTALKRGGIEGRLMEFVPPNKRTEEHFRSVFEAVGLADIVKLHKAQASQEAKRDLQQLLLDHLADNRPIKDIVLDLKETALRCGIPEHEVIGLIWVVVMGQAEWNKKEELVAEQALKHLKIYTPLFGAFTSTARSELALILKVQEFCYENMNFMKVFQKIVLLFYKKDVVSEEVILKWYKEGHSLKGKMLFLDQMKKFIEWLQNAEEESESGEEDD